MKICWWQRSAGGLDHAPSSWITASGLAALVQTAHPVQLGRGCAADLAVTRSSIWA